MKFLYVNIHGLDSIAKGQDLSKIVELDNLDFMLLQEIMGFGEKLIDSLKSCFKGWDVFDVDAIGNYGWLIIGWRTCLGLINIFSVVSSLCLELLYKGLGHAITVMHVYGSYVNK